MGDPEIRMWHVVVEDNNEVYPIEVSIGLFDSFATARDIQEEIEEKYEFRGRVFSENLDVYIREYTVNKIDVREI